MDEVCVGPDVELTDRKHPPPHCGVTRSKGAIASTSMRLEIRRVRKEGNETLKTLSDFRKYVCKVTKEGNQDGSAYVELVGEFVFFRLLSVYFSYHELV
jgi:hypothetical protein